METTNHYSKAAPMLTGKRIGLSISYSPDLARLGYGEVHLEDAMVEFARYLFANGASLAYGGDHRKKGFTQTLFELARVHNQEGVAPQTRMANYLAWPIHLNLDDARRAHLKDVTYLHECRRPATWRSTRRSS